METNAQVTTQTAGSPSLRARPGQYLSFGLGVQSYAVPIGVVREIIQVCEITPVPRTPGFVEGVINLRGKIIPVVDLNLKLRRPKSERSKQTCIIVIDSESGQVGIIVDQVNEVVDLQASQLEPAESLGASDSMDFLMGLGKLNDRVVILVDIAQTLSKERFLQELAA